MGRLQGRSSPVTEPPIPPETPATVARRKGGLKAGEDYADEAVGEEAEDDCPEGGEGEVGSVIQPFVFSRSFELTTTMASFFQARSTSLTCSDNQPWTSLSARVR
jgi:hypothetical protein